MLNHLAPALVTVAMLLQGVLPSSPRTPPAVRASCAPADTGATLRFAVIGDYGLAGQPESDVAARVAGWAPDAILTVGDNNYPSGSAATIDANIGQYYHDFICPYSGAYGVGGSSSRFLPALGNHDWVAANAQPYLDFFELPGNGRYYDYVRGPVHFFIVDSDSHEPDGIDASSRQAAWLRAALAASTSAWDIVLMHHAPYSSSSTHGSNPTLQWPYRQWGADAVIAGHDHTYERLSIDGIPYFVNGLGGSSRYAFATPLAGSQVRYSDDFGAMLVDASASDIRFQFITRAGVVIDDYTVNKPAFAPDPAKFAFQQVIGGLQLPVLVTNAGDGSGRLFIVEQTGRIKIFKNGAVLGTPFLTLPATDITTNGEGGLLTLAFDPAYATNGNFFVAYTAPRPGDSSGSILTLKRFHVSGNPDAADYSSGLVLLTIDHPTYSNHNGGTLAFGPDGYLYWSTGDGGSGGDPNNNAQNLSVLLGKMLRLDVHSAYPFVPSSNPFYTDGTTVDQLIWAYGLRNPWRTAFDRGTGDLYIGDVGQNNWEEIDYQPAGDPGGHNYGWRILEGKHCYNPSSGCSAPTAYVEPVVEYAHTYGCSVTGGYVYRGTEFPSLDGQYFYGDFCSALVWSLHNDLGPGWTATQVADLPNANELSSFGEGEDGALYLVMRTSGTVLRMIYQDPLALAAVDPLPADGTSVCSTPNIGADLLLSNATRTGGGTFNPASVKLKLDGVDITAAARIRTTATQPNFRASLVYVPPSALALGTHLVTLTYATAAGPLTAAWDFTAASVGCSTTVQQMTPAMTESPADQLPAAAPTGPSDPQFFEQATQIPWIATSSSGQAEMPEQSAQNQSLASPTPTGAPTITLTPEVPPSGGPLVCLPWGYSCQRTMQFKQ